MPAPTSTAADVEAAFAAARAAQRDWAATPVSRRAAIMLRLHDLILDRQAEGLDLVQLEAGKARRHAVEEVLDCAINARYYARTAAKALRPRRRGGALPVLTRTRELRFPIGVVGVLSPWNYPLALATSEVDPGADGRQHRRAPPRPGGHAQRPLGPVAGDRGRAARRDLAGRLR